MRVLFVSNLYPPHYMGGYEIGCSWVADEMTAQGHVVAVLTSSYGLPKPQIEGHVYRTLLFSERPKYKHQVLELPRVLHREIVCRRRLFEAVASFRPELVYIWGLRGVSASLGQWARAARIPVCLYVSDEWPLGGDSWYRFHHGLNSSATVKWFGRSLLPVARSLGFAPKAVHDEIAYAHATSDFIKDRLALSVFPIGTIETIRWGVPLERYKCRVRTSRARSIIFGGRLTEDKGIHVVLDALIMLRNRGELPSDFRTTIVGRWPATAYAARLENTIADLSRTHVVRRPGLLSSNELRDALDDHDVFVLPTIGEEPFSIFLVEAMACGMACVATATGGTPELIREGNGILVAPSDSRAMAEALGQLICEDSRVLPSISRGARQTVEARFSLGRMVQRICESLQRIVASDTARDVDTAGMARIGPMT
jgi:glycosyltransferase involved in cell wall biosynthesis